MQRFLLFIILFSETLFAQQSNDSSVVQLFHDVIFTLANDSMKGRATGSLEEQKSLLFIDQQFTELTKHKLRKQSFEASLNDTTQLDAVNGYYFFNHHSKHTVILSAHYDHIGMGGPLSMSKKNDVVHNGADDNASGVALLLALMEKMAQAKSAPVNYLIVFYSGHEIGLFGSAAFSELVQRKKRKYKTISVVINFDMVGRLHPELLKLKCLRSPAIDSVLQLVDPIPFGFKLNVANEEQLKQLDTKSFYNAGIPCINFSTGIHNDYHTITDDPQYINLLGMLAIYHYLQELIPLIP